MNIMATLNTFKGKELDDALMQLITKIFDAQHNEIDHLKEDNISLQKNVSDFRGKMAISMDENKALRKTVNQLQSQVSAMQLSASQSRLSEVETAVLSTCINSGISSFCSEDMVVSLIYSRLEITNAIDQLERKGLIQVGPLAPIGTFYSITETGKKYEHDIEKDTYSF